MRRPALHATRRHGFSSVMVIAIIVALASLCAFALRFVATAQSTGTLDLLQARAQQAAEAGIEWQRMQILQTAVPCAAGSGLVTNVMVPFTTGNFAVQVTCINQGAVVQNGVSITTFSMVAVACYPSASGLCPNAAAMPGEYVERQISAVATKP